MNWTIGLCAQLHRVENICFLIISLRHSRPWIVVDSSYTELRKYSFITKKIICSIQATGQMFIKSNRCIKKEVLETFFVELLKIQRTFKVNWWISLNQSLRLYAQFILQDLRQGRFSSCILFFFLHSSYTLKK